MLTTNADGRVVRWVPLSLLWALGATAFFFGGYVGSITAPAQTTTLQATRDSLKDTRTECKELANMTYDFATDLSRWMMIAHTDHLEGAD